MNDKPVPNKKPLFIAIGVTLLLLLVIVIVALAGALRRTEPEAPAVSGQPAVVRETVPVEPQGGGRGTVATSENISQILDELNREVEDGYYETRMNREWEFTKSTEPSANAYVENSPNNARTVYFDLISSDTGELLYSSPFIPVGARLENFALDKELPAGDHEAVVTYHLVDDDNRDITTLSVAVTLKVEG